MLARQRLFPGLVGLIAFTAVASFYEWPFWSSWWFYIGTATMMGAVFLEPYFSSPQDALANGIGAIAAFYTVERAGGEILWLCYVILGLLMIAAGAAAALMSDDESLLKATSRRLAMSLGKAHVVGPLAIAVFALSNAHAGRELLGLALIPLLIGTVPQWEELIRMLRLRYSEHGAVAVAAYGPKMMLIGAVSTDIKVGETLRLRTRDRSIRGVVVSRVPHKSGLRYRVALEHEWNKLCSEFPTTITVQRSEDLLDIAGTVVEGTTDISLEFEPVATLQVGDPVSITMDSALSLYQVTNVKLTPTAWDGANALTPHARPLHVGSPLDGHIRFRPRLPEPHEVVYSASEAQMALPPRYMRLGIAKATKIEIGMDLSSSRAGHLAILGMSGMGKTSVAQGLCLGLGLQHLVIAVDTTGEYRSRLAFPTWPDDMNSTGHFVYEPSGDPPERAADFIRRAMTAAKSEYDSGGPCLRRVILLEEAHGFVPEWNFATRNQGDHVGFSARMVMQARKFEVGFVVVSQRTAVVSKSVLSQCENYIILKTVDETSLSYLEGIFGSVVRQAVPSLERFEAICAGPAFNSDAPVIVTLDAPAKPA